MIEAEYSAAAEGDVAWAWLASRNRWGDDQADRYIDMLHAAVEQLCLFPESGNDRSELVPGLRSKVMKTHVIFYRLVGETLQVVRVLHVRQDPTEHL